MTNKSPDSSTQIVRVVNTNHNVVHLTSMDGDKVTVNPLSNVPVMKKFTTKLPAGVRIVNQ